MPEQTKINLNIPAPRYTSYPPVPFWENVGIVREKWFHEVSNAYEAGNREVSLYLHLLFCESLCTYCACNTRITKDHSVEKPFIQRLLKEWSLYLDAFGSTPTLTDLHFGGGTPTFFSPENLGELMGGILRTSQVTKGTNFSFEAHPANTTSSHLEVLYKNGFRRMSLGVQDFNPRVMELINRKQTAEQVRAVTNLARIIGFSSVNFDLIYGLPGQTRNSISQTILQVIEMRPDRIALYGYAHVPKMKPAQLSFEQFLPSSEERVELCELSKELLVDAGYREIGLDHYALPGDELLTASLCGNLHRNFMGYTTTPSPLLIGLGPSAISDTASMMAQNSPTLEQWNVAMDNKEWVGHRGHVLTTEDMILRKHILNIMCRFETFWGEDVASAPFLETVYQRLKIYEVEGLIKLTPVSVKVLPQGKTFLRHIGMCFDARFHNRKDQDVVLSSAS